MSLVSAAVSVYVQSGGGLSTPLTFDLQEHEFLVWHGAVVGRLLRDVDAAQVDIAEVLLAGQAGQGHLRET